MSERTKIAVVGSTGRVGRHVVDLLTASGHDVVPISRSSGVDVITGDGLAEALVGVQTIVDAATGPSPDKDEATRFFTTAAANLHRAGQRAGVQQMVVVSIIGIDRLTPGSGYNAAKLAHEQAALSGPIPARILRAAQFHEFVGQLMDWGRRGDVVYVPRMRTQLVAARTVAEALADLATAAGPAGTSGSDGASIPEIAGPRTETLADMAVLLADRRHDAVKIEAVDDPSNPDNERIATGALLPGPHATLGGPTFEEWLAATS
jgi:uncharacterized protein YbjT (DUF2867 family)